jgi:hypothetical protein
LNTISYYQQLYQKKLAKRIALEFIFAFIVMYFGCRIYPNSLLPAQPIYLSTAVVFALYSIRGYRITAGLFFGGVLAHYFSPATSALLYPPTKLIASMAATIQILFCAFFIRYLLDKAHMALVSMRNLKEICVFIILSLAIPQLVFNLFITPSIPLMVTGLGHSMGILSISSMFLVWNAYVPHLNPPPLPRQLFVLSNVLWLIMGTGTYLFCYKLYSLEQEMFYPYFLIYFLGYIIFLMIFIGLLAKFSNRFFGAIGMGVVGIFVLFYAILHPEINAGREWLTAGVQISIIFTTAVWLGFLAKARS